MKLTFISMIVELLILPLLVSNGRYISTSCPWICLKFYYLLRNGHWHLQSGVWLQVGSNQWPLFDGNGAHKRFCQKLGGTIFKILFVKHFKVLCNVFYGLITMHLKEILTLRNLMFTLKKLKVKGGISPKWQLCCVKSLPCKNPREFHIYKCYLISWLSKD
jgi:hypothetical protein